MLSISHIWRTTVSNIKCTFTRHIHTSSNLMARINDNSISNTSQLLDNSSQPPDWKKHAPSPPTDSLTTAAQAGLPRLPVPDLRATLNKLLESLRPLAKSEEEYKEAERKVDEFARGLGGVLQKRLVQRSKEKEHWLEEWWDNGGYLGYRDSVVVNVSYFYGFDPHPPQYPQTAVSRAAALIRAALLFRRQYKRGLLPPETVKEGPICMDTYRWMFDCCRIPSLDGLDWSVSYAKEGDMGEEPAHIVFLRKGRVWKVDAVRGGRILSMRDWEKQIKYIYDNTEKECPGVGVLTATNRDTWAKNYATLIGSSQNQTVLQVIHSSAFVLCLDSTSPPHPVPGPSTFPDPSLSRILWHGGSSGSELSNRWVDKPLQFIVCENGEAGIMGEHSVMDGTPVARMCDNVLDWIAGPEFDSGDSASGADGAELENPVALDWAVGPEVERAIEDAKKEVKELCDSQSLIVFNTSHGKRAAKSFGFSPDSWTQLIIQLGYSRFLKSISRARNDIGGTYEAASTRRHLKGRTETVRIVSEECDRWVKSMDEDSVVDADEKKRLFSEAAKKHNLLAREAGKGLGCDRHLFGLKHLIQKDEQLPELFSDPLYTRSSHWALSTSAIFSKHFDAYGWGEVVSDGFGVAYMTGFDDRFMFTLTSRVDSGMPIEGFAKEIQKAADDLYTLFSNNSGDGEDGSMNRKESKL